MILVVKSVCLNQGRTQDIFSRKGAVKAKKFVWLCPLCQPFISAFYLIRWHLPALFTLLESFNISVNLGVYIKKPYLESLWGATAPLAPLPLCRPWFKSCFYYPHYLSCSLLAGSFQFSDHRIKFLQDHQIDIQFRIVVATIIITHNN